MLYYAGIDAGSCNIKAAVVSASGALAGTAVTPRGADIAASARACYGDALRAAGLGEGDVAAIVSTGYGRRQLPWCSAVLTDISSISAGCHRLAPGEKTIIDVGGQDSKVILSDKDGRAVDFVMNHKCSSGTGKFLEVTARSLGVGVEELSGLAAGSREALRLSSTCTVFAETEIISLLAEGKKKEDIVMALHHTISVQVSGLMRQLNIASGGTAYFVGGVAANASVVSALSALTGVKMIVPPHAQFMGAYGAAVHAGSGGRG